MDQVGDGIRRRRAYWSGLLLAAVVCGFIVPKLFGLDREGIDAIDTLVSAVGFWGLLLVNLWPVKVDPDTSGEATKSLARSRFVPSFRQIDRPVDFAGVMLLVFGLVLTATVVWSAVTTLRVRLRPNIVETRSAGDGFPMRAELRADVIVFSNVSAEAWSCSIDIGPERNLRHHAAVSLPAGGSRFIRYEDFSRADGEDPKALRFAARDRLRAACTNGTQHRLAYLR